MDGASTEERTTALTSARAHRPRRCPDAALARYSDIRRDPVPPAVAMESCLDWLEGLGPELALAAHPLLMDGIWLDWYLRRFCNAAVFSGPFRIRCPFVSTGVDVPSYVQAALKMEYFTARPDYPPELLRDVPHTHKPIDDARGHAARYFRAQRYARTRQAS